MSEKTIGFILILGFVMLVAGAAIAPSAAYEGSIEDRLAVINSNEGQWLLSKVFDGLAVVFASVGLVMLAIVNNRSHGGWLNTLGGVCLGIAGIVGLVWIYILVTDPGPLYDRETPAPIVVLFITMVALGLLAFGLHFLRADYPRWVGLVTAVVGGGILVAQVLIQILNTGPEVAFGLGSLMYLVFLAIGIMLVRRPGKPKKHELEPQSSSRNSK